MPRPSPPEFRARAFALANAILDYIAIFYNRQRRHSGLEYRTLIEHELHC
jgi:hypothetical protein